MLKQPKTDKSWPQLEQLIKEEWVLIYLLVPRSGTIPGTYGFHGMRNNCCQPPEDGKIKSDRLY